MPPDPITPEKPTLAALGLEKPLSSTAPPDQLAAAREVQDTAALTWLAMADLQPAPESIWQGILCQTAAPAAFPAAPAPRRWQLPLTYGGWAAAAALALGWWLQDAAPTTAPDPKPAVVHTNQPNHTVPNKTASLFPSTAVTAPVSREEASLREELQQLRQRLATAAEQPDIPGLHRPAIVELRAPDSNGTPAAPGEAAARLQQLVTRALQRDLILRQNADNSAIVLERGWPTSTWLPTDSGQTIRHLSFPAGRWEELGLWKSSDFYYDPATSLTWSPAPDGLGYIGSITPAPADTTAFTKPRPKAELPQSSAEPNLQAKPSGYLVSESGSGDATLLLSDLPPVPEGSQQFVIARNANGTTRQYQIAGTGTTIEDSFIRSTSINAGFSTDSLTLSALTFPGGFTNFEVVQTAVGRSTPTVILTSGQP